MPIADISGGTNKLIKNMNDSICISFANPNDMAAFIRLYRGTTWSHYDNYKGVVRTDRHLFMHDDWVVLERSKVVNFSRLRQDVDMHKGTIML